jgi:hypothetical protein
LGKWPKCSEKSPKIEPNFDWFYLNNNFIILGNLTQKVSMQSLCYNKFSQMANFRPIGSHWIEWPIPNPSGCYRAT